jgi:hypothetical protein
MHDAAASTALRRRHLAADERLPDVQRLVDQFVLPVSISVDFFRGFAARVVFLPRPRVIPNTEPR